MVPLAYLVMSHQSVSLSDREKRVTAVEVLEKERIDCEKEVVYLRMEGDFADKKEGGPELAKEIETRGFDWIRKEAGEL